MFQGDVTLTGGEAVVVWFYQTAAVCRSWTIHRSAQNHWTLRAEVTRADPFRLRQADLLFRAPRRGGYFCWPVVGLTLTGQQLAGTLGPPVS